MLRYQSAATCRVSLRDSVFDEGFQPRECGIPLLRDEIKVFSDSFDRLGIKFESTLAAPTDAAHDSHTLQNSKMFSDRLPGQLRTLG